MIQLAHRSSVAPVRPAPSFREWRRAVSAEGAPPVVAVAGSRGKTTVVRLLDAIFNEAGLQTATWTDLGVEIGGRRQSGELRPWSWVLAGLGSGAIDVAIQELDWAMVHAVGLPSATYPVVAITNICVNNDACLVQEETRVAMRARGAVFAATHPHGFLALNADDFAVAGDEVGYDRPAILVGMSRDQPLMRMQLEAGGTAAWLDEGELAFGTALDAMPLVAAPNLRFALGGAAAFEVHNALLAAAIAAACGVELSTVRSALTTFVTRSELMPGSFNVVRVGDATAVIDRPDPPWFLRPILRAVTHVEHGRILFVIGRMETVSDDEMSEVGRLLGRAGEALIVHSQDRGAARVELLRQGAAQNDVPPLLIYAPGERAAVNRGLKMLRPHDTLVILADQPEAVARTLARAAAERNGD